MRNSWQEEEERKIYFGDWIEGDGDLPGGQWADGEASSEARSDAEDGEPADGEGAPDRVRKPRKKKHVFLKTVLVLLLLGGLYVIATSPLFEVRGIKVEGASHFSEAQIIDLSGLETGGNLWKAKLGAAEKTLLTQPYIKAVEMHRDIPHRINIVVTERKELFALACESRWLILDDEAVLLAEADVAPALPLVEGIEVNSTQAGVLLDVAQKTLLEDTRNLLAAAGKEGVPITRLVVKDTSAEAYLSESFKITGSFENITKNMNGIAKVINDLAVKGIYTGRILVSATTCTYSPEL
ncbi:MAG: FtsQ-type POTRA domain-containing protein [Clostridiales Family XIII bacterium]|jgi:cell division protein FtsQ|nr:FtsQ-type POTRA domain-containing protein [Clostridiales Family XIII bacterium]